MNNSFVIGNRIINGAAIQYVERQGDGLLLYFEGDRQPLALYGEEAEAAWKQLETCSVPLDGKPDESTGDKDNREIAVAVVDHFLEALKQIHKIVQPGNEIPPRVKVEITAAIGKIMRIFPVKHWTERNREAAHEW